MSDKTIHRIFNPSGVDYIKESFTPTENMDQEKMAEFFKGLLKDSPTSCFFVMAIEDDNVTGHVVAFIHPSRTHVVLFDLGAKDGNLSEQLVLRLLFWCEQLQAPEVRFESERVKLDAEKWGFSPKSTTFCLKISNKIESLILESMKKESKNAPADVCTDGKESSTLDGSVGKPVPGI